MLSDFATKPWMRVGGLRDGGFADSRVARQSSIKQSGDFTHGYLQAGAGQFEDFRRREQGYRHAAPSVMRFYAGLDEKRRWSEIGFSPYIADFG
jgi:hypothetical protein